MTQAQLSTLSPVALPPVTYKGQPVVTTEMLAQAYGCSAANIRDNFRKNKERFIESKHFYSLQNGELQAFRDCTENFRTVVPARTRNLTLWLERGAARHAKMLNTDKAWDVFEMLEETFFRAVKPEPTPALDTATRLSKRGDPERKELHALVNTWVGCAPLHYAAVNSIINAHIGVSGVDEMTIAQVKEAIEFARKKIAEATAPSLPPAEPASAVTLRAKCDELDQAVRTARDITRDLWRMVDAHKKSIDREKGVYGTSRHGLMGTLHKTCEAAFMAWEYEADAIAHSVKAMRILAEDMR